MTSMDWDLLERYLARDCTAEERERVEQWMAAEQSNRCRVELLAKALVAAPATPKVEVWESIERQLGAPGKSFSLGQRSEGSRVIKVAALLVAVGAGGLVARALLAPKPEAAPPASAMRVVTTPPGQRASFRLPDGTSVMLGVASTLKHPISFGVGGRNVELEGEAYFEVVHEEGRAFTVRAGDIVAEDLGTEFVVRAYPEDRHARVVVREGKVALRSATEQQHTAQQILLPGQLGRLKAGGEPVAEPADTTTYFAWTDGLLVFDDVELRDAIPQLSRWYDLEFRLADSSLGRVPLTATFRNQPTEDVLDLLAASLGMRQVRSGRTVTFFPATGGR